MNCCCPLYYQRAVFAEYYAKKRAEGKPYRVALTHVAKKLLRVIYTMQTKNIRYDSTMIPKMHPFFFKSSARGLAFLRPFSSLKNFFAKGLTSYSWSPLILIYTR